MLFSLLKVNSCISKRGRRGALEYCTRKFWFSSANYRCL